MWVAYALGSAFFAGITSILAKCGIRNTDSHVATAIRTIVVLIFSWLMVFITGSEKQFSNIDTTAAVFLLLSGLATGASWLCYFKALQEGDINKVVPVDKSSTILTMMLAFIFLGEAITSLKVFCIILIGLGTMLMIQKRRGDETQHNGKMWFVYALLSAVFASLTAILGKIGINGIDSNLGTAIRTIVVLVMAWVVVFAANKQRSIYSVPKNEMSFICLSGIATGASWMCYYRALQEGLACVVVPIDKLSILVTIVFSYIVFKEKLTRKAGTGLIMIVVGTLLMLV